MGGRAKERQGLARWDWQTELNTQGMKRWSHIKYHIVESRVSSKAKNIYRLE